MGDEGALREGSILSGRYRIEGVAGRGGMGVVYRAHDVELGERIALKLLGPDAGADAAALERFRREVQLARRVTHRNVARTYDIGAAGELRFLTMELVEGPTLRRVISRDGAFAPARAVGLVRELCGGLAAAHGAGVVHRDLKPGNVLLADRPVITDFGIARLAGGDAPIAAGEGTPQYMAPEQLTGAAGDGRTDLYALGVMLFELLTGTLPFEGESSEAIALARLRLDPPDPGARVPLPPGLAALVLRCLCRDPDGRPAGARALAELLAPYEGDAAPAPAVAAGPDRDAATRPAAPPAAAAAPRAARSLAVLPFRATSPDDALLGEALADELSDVLARTRDLRVTAASAAAGAGTDPRAAGAALGVETVASGTLRRAGDRAVIALRLVDVKSGFQLWGGRFEAPLAEVLELQETLGQRLAEALRLELDTLAHRGDAPAEAIEIYLGARASLRSYDDAARRAEIEALERCLALAPRFRPAFAALASGRVRDAFVAGLHDVDHRARAQAAVERALREAPDLAESHVAAAQLAMLCGDPRGAVASLGRALRIAPTCADALQQLGVVECEAGRHADGVPRLRLAVAVAPNLVLARAYLARETAYEGALADALAIVDDLWKAPRRSPIVLITHCRLAAWSHDRARLESCLDCFGDGATYQPLIGVMLRYALGELTPDAFDELVAGARVGRVQPRVAALVAQLAAEAHASRDEDERALVQVRRAAGELELLDVGWMDRCPGLARVRALPGFAPLRAEVARRAAAVWRP